MASSDPMTDGTIPEAASARSLFLPSLSLLVIEGPDRGVSARMTGRRFAIGTASDNDLALTDRGVSRHHLVLESGPDGVTVIDLGSTNGTRLDGVRVVRAIAEPRQRIAIGATVLSIESASAPVEIPLSSRESMGGLVGRSAEMRELYTVLERAASSDASVLLHGETGTGKELAAEAIHEASSRREGPFVAIDCGAIPATLFESELFGYTKGAFTGASRDHTGLLLEAHGGTVFLDEIGELAPELQPKLLRALERRQVRPVGASAPVDFDVRIVAATHRDLAAEVNRGTFREDLYFRLAVLRVFMPPLRARREDVALLVRFFVERLAPGRAGEADRIADVLRHRSFPGNVRELRNAVEETLVLGGTFGRRSETPASPEALYSLAYKDASEAALEAFQRDYLGRLMSRTKGNVSLAAREADMSRRYLQTLLQRLGLAGE
jgi:DNA-binding NtrC family response regulator